VLSTESQEDLRNTLGLDIRELDGKLIEKSDDSVMISVRLATGPQVLGAQPLHQRIAVTRQGVARVDMQKTDPVKTAGLVGIIAGAVTYGIIQLFEPQDPGSPDVEPPPPDEHLRGVLLRVKVFSW